jgi:hypothetical protein
VSRLIAAAVLLVAFFPLGAFADVEAQTGPSLEVTIGPGGFSPRDRPAEVAATISTPVLVSGRLRVRGGNVSVSRPVEVPAGGSQTYAVTIPPLVDGTRLTVEVLDHADDVVVSETVTLRTPSREGLIVGVLGGGDLVPALERVRTVVTDTPVSAIPVALETPASSWDIVDYLIIGRETSDRAEEALNWVASGGRVVVDSSMDISSVEDFRPTGVDGVMTGTIGSGEVVVVDSLASRSDDDWTAILRPTPLDFSNIPEFVGDQGGLITAASEAGTRQVPTLPWLLFAILGFALVVGPVNFVVLSRLDRRDWAWVTIPLLSLMAVVGFWVAGRQRITGTNLTHASIIVQDGTIRARSAVLVTAGAAGERRLAFEENVRVFPERSIFGAGGTELRLDGPGSARVDLAQLGFTGVGVEAESSALDLLRVGLEDGDVVVTNASDLSFWGWGVAAGGSSTVSPSDLNTGESSRLALPAPRAGEFGFSFIDSLMNQRRLWEDPVRSNSLWPLSQPLVSEMDANGIYFVGLTDDYRPPVSVEGEGGDFPGPTVVLVKIGDLSAPGADAGVHRAGATVVGTGFVNWVEPGVQQIIATDEMTVRFRLPDPTLEVRLENDQRFGMAPAAYEAWHWGRGEFVEMAVNEILPPEFISSDGLVFVRLRGANEFGDNPMSAADLRLEWET